MDDKERYLTPKEYAEIMRVNPVTVRNLLRQGKIEHVKIGRLWRIPISATKPSANSEDAGNGGR